MYEGYQPNIDYSYNQGAAIRNEIEEYTNSQEIPFSQKLVDKEDESTELSTTTKHENSLISSNKLKSTTSQSDEEDDTASLSAGSTKRKRDLKWQDRD